MKSITLKLTDYVIKGIADITDWYGQNGCIEMQSFNVQTLKQIKDNLNDSGFGVQSINGALCDLYRNYQGTLKYSRTLYIGKISEHTKNHYFECV